MTDAVLVLTTVPSEAVGESIARALVDSSLAACVNVLPVMTSIYRWQGALEQSRESQLVIKTSRSVVDAVEASIRALHPYELPEFLVVAVEGGGREYLGWVAGSVAN